MNHQALFNQDLRGWKLAIVLSLELKHDLMGFFPALTAEDDMLFVCLDENLLAAVEKMLPPRQHKVTTFKALVNEEKGIAFDLGIIHEERFRENHDKDTHIPILTQKKFDALTSQSKKPFKWAPGLISDDMTPDEFMDTLKAAIEEKVD